MAGALLVVLALGGVLLRAPISGRLPVARALAAAIPMPGGVLPPYAMDRTWYVQTDSSLYFQGGAGPGVAAVDGRFSDVRGTWTLDVEQPSRMRGDVEVGIASVKTGDGTRDALLKSAAWLNADGDHDLTARLGGVSGWPGVLRRATSVDFAMAGRLSVRRVGRDVTWQCALEPDAHQLLLHCSASVAPGDFGLPGLGGASASGPVLLTAQMHFADQLG